MRGDPVMDIRPGLFGKYELQERLGRGGMAEVWKALISFRNRNGLALPLYQRCN